MLLYASSCKFPSAFAQAPQFRRCFPNTPPGRSRAEQPSHPFERIAPHAPADTLQPTPTPRLAQIAQAARAQFRANAIRPEAEKSVQAADALALCRMAFLHSSP